MLAGLVLILAVAGSASAASRETVLYAFHGKDGRGPGSVIVAPDGTLYGTTWFGGKIHCPGSGSLGCGVVFRLTRDANGKWRETVLHAFDDDNTDGSLPAGSLTLDKNGNLYGTTVYGGPLNECSNQGCGVVFELTPGADGKWTYRVVHAFDVTDGAAPWDGLIFDSAGNLHGTTSGGGNTDACTGGCGVVFQLTPSEGDRWTETVLYSFGGSDGEEPRAPLTFDAAGNLYGNAEFGGAYGAGAVFVLTPGAGGKWTEKVLYSFDNTDGYQPSYGLIFDASGNLYGTTPLGGAYGWGTAFKLTPDRDGKWTETVLHSFDQNKIGGGYPSSGLVFDKRGNLYGATTSGGKYTCPGGGSVACGVVFRLTPHANGRWAETVLHSFGKGKDGAGPVGGLARDSAGHLFGLAYEGGYLGAPCGKDGCGVVFEVAP